MLQDRKWARVLSNVGHSGLLKACPFIQAFHRKMVDCAFEVHQALPDFSPSSNSVIFCFLVTPLKAFCIKSDLGYDENTSVCSFPKTPVGFQSLHTHTHTC